jgi:hypothetical protein
MCSWTAPTFVLEEVAHARAAGEYQLRNILYDLCLILGGERGEPLGQALQMFSMGD